MARHQTLRGGLVTRPSVETGPALPMWLLHLVEDTWRLAEWRVWERVWRPELAKRGITPDMLEPVGDPVRPRGISALSADKGRRWGGIDWEADPQLTAVLTGMRRLVAELDRA